MITDLFKRLAKAVFKRIDTGKFLEESVGKKQHPVRSSEDIRSSPETQWIPRKSLTSALPSANQKRLDSQTPLITRTPLARQAPQASQTPLITRTPLARQAPLASRTPPPNRSPLFDQTPLPSDIPLTTRTLLGPQRSLASEIPLASETTRASETTLSNRTPLAPTSRTIQTTKIPRNRTPLHPQTPLANQTAQAMEIIQAVQLVEDSSNSGKDSVDKEPPSLKQNEKDKEEDLDDMPTWRDPHGRKAIITSKGMGRSVNV